MTNCLRPIILQGEVKTGGHERSFPESRKRFAQLGWLARITTLHVLLAATAHAGPGLNTDSPIGFFTNVSDRLLKTYTAEWLAADYGYFTNHFQVTKAFGITNIPVFVNGRMVYSPAVHRVLQLAANMWDAQTNRQDGFGPLPTVFQPLFTVTNNDVFISAFREVTNTTDLQAVSRPPLDLTVSPTLPSPFPADELIFGVPLVVGARKGLPNFNESSMESVFMITRKIELVKSGPGGQDKIIQTNQFFTMNVYMAAGAEFWNSYRSNYTRPVDIFVTNRVTMSLTNDNPSCVPIVKTVVASGTMGTNVWSGWKEFNSHDRSFMVPLRTNINLFVPQGVAYLPGSGVFMEVSNAVYEVDSRLLLPRWFLTITNRVQAMIVESGTGRIIDYVLLGDMTSHFDFAREIAQDPSAGDPTNPFRKLWGTNAIGTLLSGQPGIVQQLLASKGVFGNLNSSEWTDQGSFIGNRSAEIAKFKAFFTPNHLATYTDPQTGLVYTGSNVNLSANAPFTPSVTVTVPMSWQANDPQVHHIARDMLDVGGVGGPTRIRPPGDTNQLAANILKNIGAKNKRYKPWSVDPSAIYDDPDASNLTLKDPLVTSSDDWQFPTNSLPGIGWLGRVHRGTPWQTIYLKASDLGLQPQTYAAILNSPSQWATDATYVPFAIKWSQWTGNPDLGEGFFTRPVTDRVLFDQFAATFNTNDPRHVISFNELHSNIWLAALDGIVALTNLYAFPNPPQFNPVTMTSNSPQAAILAAGINAERLRTNSAGQFIHRGGWFEHIGDILSVPELTELSPFLNTNGVYTLLRGVSDEAYEIIPTQLLLRLRPDSMGSVFNTGSALKIQFTGFDDYSYAVETSSNLLNWLPFATNYPTNGVFEFTEPVAVGSDRRFYRSVLLP